MTSPPPPTDSPAPDNAAGDPGLRRWRRVAHGCLALAAALWLLALVGPRHLPPTWSLGLGFRWDEGDWAMLRLMAESGLVGGLADWFAITALFRRPLGLPIPHTALVPRNRDRIADGIAAYIDSEFLAPPMLRAQIRRIDPVGRLARALATPQARAQATALLMAALPRLLAPERDAALRRLLTRAARDGLARVDLGPTLAGIVRDTLASPALEGLITDLSDHAIGLVTARRDAIRQAVAAKSRWWIPGAVDTSLADQVTQAVLDHLYDLRSPQSDAGRGLRQWLAGLPDQLETGAGPGAAGVPTAWTARLTALARAALGARTLGPLLRQTLDSLRAVWADGDGKMGGGGTGGGAMVLRALGAAIDSLAQALSEPALKARLDATLEDALMAAIPGWRQDIRAFVADTLRGQDIALFTRRLEARVGRDLQYVRINGTVLGALIGAGLHLLAGVLSG